MSLTSGRGPLGHAPAGAFDPPVPSGVTYTEPFHRRVRGCDGDRVLVDSERVVLVHRAGAPPTYAFPSSDVHDIAATDEPALDGYVAVAWDAVPQWFEEDEQVVGHPRNPYHRIDCVRSRRRLRVTASEVTLVDTDDVVFLDETALLPRLYVAREHVRMDLLVPSDTRTYCPYKGEASYWSLAADDVTVADVAWSYDDPLPESSPIATMLCFDDRRVEVTADLPSASSTASDQSDRNHRPSGDGRPNEGSTTT